MIPNIQQYFDLILPLQFNDVKVVLGSGFILSTTSIILSFFAVAILLWFMFVAHSPISEKSGTSFVSVETGNSSVSKTSGNGGTKQMFPNISTYPKPLAYTAAPEYPLTAPKYPNNLNAYDYQRNGSFENLQTLQRIYRSDMYPAGHLYYVHPQIPEVEEPPAETTPTISPDKAAMIERYLSSCSRANSYDDEDEDKVAPSSSASCQPTVRFLEAPVNFTELKRSNTMDTIKD